MSRPAAPDDARSAMSASAYEGSDGALVRRPRLFEALQRGTAGPVTLVTGPAGSGKTVLVRSWVRAGVFAKSGAWITVARGERDGLRFWGSVLEELRASGVATRAPGLRTLAVAPRGPVDELVRRLAERIDRLTDPALLVLDDVQHLEAQDALEALTWMLARAPRELRVILIGRREPQVGAHRLRVAGALTEIGEPDLRFTREEARELFARASVSLSDESLDRLHARTEGWAAGLRLAAIGLTGLGDTRRFVSEFSGSERTVADYLIAEVLAAQPPEVRQLLLRTCVLERVNGPLANLLAGVRDGERMLQGLEDTGALVNSVDSDRSWFRYHHLLSDLLRLELRREAPEEVESLHRKAARWYALHGFAVEAIRHAQAGGDWDHAGDLLMDHWLSLFLDGRQATIRGLLSALPANRVRSDAELATVVARPQGGVPAPHFLSSSARALELRASVRLGDLGPARLALAEADEAERNLVDWRNLAACLHLADDKPKEALEALAPVLDGSAAAMHANLEAEALVLEAIARDRLGEATAAEEALERALDLAEPERQVWTIFTAPGVRSLLEHHTHQRTAHRAVIAELLDRSIGIETARRSEETAELREPLTDRELDVLRYLPTHLSAGEIAGELSLSVHTVKTHMRSLYGKLDVHRRSEAVEHALALELLPR